MHKFTHRKKLKINQDKKTKLAISIAGFILILLILIVLVFPSGLFNVKMIDASLNGNLNCVSADQLKKESKLLGVNIFFVDRLSNVKNIKAGFICIKEIKLTKNFPDKVNLDVMGRESRVRLLVLNKMATTSAILENISTPSAKIVQTAYLADEETIFAKEINQDSDSQIYLPGLDLSLGKKIGETIKKSISILEKLKTFGLSTQTTQLVNEFLIIFPSESQPRIIFSLEKDNNLQLASLQLILEKAKIDKESMEFIDLRFDKPIVRFAPKKK